MNLDKLYEKADESISLLKKKICLITANQTGKPFIFVTPPINKLGYDKFSCEVRHMQHLLLMAEDAENAVDDYKDQVELLEEQLKIVKETNIILNNSLNSMAK